MASNSAFMKIVDSLEDSFQKLITAPPVKYCNLPRDLPKRAIYLFSKGDVYLYVGRTNNLKSRLRGHCIPSATHTTAAFAFKIARELTDNLKASYCSRGSRSELCKDPIFSPAFSDAKRQLRETMDIRFIQEDDPVTQALLEIYVSLALKTFYNDFDNH